MPKKVQSFVNETPEIQVTSGNQSTCKENTADKESQQNDVQNKASTPVNLGQKAASFFIPDISRISTSQQSTASGYNSMSKSSSLPSLCDISKPGPSRIKLANLAASQKKKQKTNIACQRRLEDLQSNYLQMYALCQLQEKQNKKENTGLKKVLEQLQNKIAVDKRVLEETRTQIQQVKINCEIEKIHRHHAAVFQQVLDKLEASNCDANLKEISELLEYFKDKVQVKDIELPEDGLEQLVKNMKHVIESVKELSSKHNFEAYNRLGKVNVIVKDCEEAAKRCKDKLADLEWLKLQETSLKISYPDDV